MDKGLLEQRYLIDLVSIFWTKVCAIYDENLQTFNTYSNCWFSAPVPVSFKLPPLIIMCKGLKKKVNFKVFVVSWFKIHKCLLL